MKEFSCKSVDPTCDYTVSGETDQEVLDKAIEHGKEKHGITEFTDELKSKVKSLIRDKKEAA